MSKITKWIVPLVAVALLTACSGDTGGDASREELLRAAGVPSEAPQTEMQAPTPATQVQQVEVTRETVRDVPVEVTRIVVVQVTPAPQIQGFDAPAPAQSNVTGYADSSTCDTTQAQPAPAGGNVDRVVGCVGEWNKAYEVRP